MTRLTRRAALRTGATLGAALGAGCAGVLRRDDAPAPGDVGLELVAEGFVAPVDVVATRAGPRRLYVVDQPGRVHVVDGDGRRGEPLLDLTDRVVAVEGYDERGLLGMALHPDFADNGRCFVRYSAPSRRDTPADYSHTFVLAEFAAGPDGLRADPDSERPLLEIPEPQANHNAGDLAFGPDGYLYVGVGDGGLAGDRGPGHVADWYDGVPGGNGQDVTANLLGSILRIDVDGEDESRPYAVPDDNPLVGRDGRDEHYAWGFRNPWRLSIDPDGDLAGDGPDLYVADVGQNTYEEVNLVARGGNYGWNVREATHCFRPARQGGVGGDCPGEAPGGRPLRDPVVEYPHGDVGEGEDGGGGAGSDDGGGSGDGDGTAAGGTGSDSGGTAGPPPVSGVAVVGGYRYRGSAVSALAGRYVFGDWMANGRLFAATPADGGGLWTPSVLDLTPAARESMGSYLLSFGRDRDRELLVCSSDEGGVAGRTGAVHRIVAP